MWRVFLTAAVLAASAAPARAAFIIMVDEFGNGIGTRGSGFFANDPGPGGLPNVLTYNLPFAGVQGDVLIVDTPGTPPLDVIRFNGDGTLIFYSDNVDGFDAPGDTPSPPGAFYTNVATIFETGPEGNAIAVYTPLQGQ